MRKLFLVLLAVLFVGGIAYAGVATNPGGPGDQMGQGKQLSEAHKVFRIVRYVPNSGNADSTTLTANSIVIWDTTSADGVTVTTTTTSGDSRVAGVLISTTLTPDTLGRTATQDALYGGRNWGWLQTYGQSQVRFATAASGKATAGYAFGTSGANGSADGFTFDTVVLAPGTAFTGSARLGIAGFIYTAPAATSGAEGGVFIKGLD